MLDHNQLADNLKKLIKHFYRGDTGSSSQEGGTIPIILHKSILETHLQWVKCHQMSF